MLVISPIQSPLAEKRMVLFTIKKQMIGRRAYTASVYTKTKIHVEEHSTSSSTCSSPRVSPSSPSVAEIEFKAFNVDAC